MGFKDFMESFAYGLGGRQNPVYAEAKSMGLSVEEYQKLRREAALLQAEQTRQAIASQKLQDAATQESTYGESIKNSDALAKFMSMAGGLQPGESRSLYKPLPVGASVPDMPNVGVGEETGEQAASKFYSGEQERKVANEIFQRFKATQDIRQADERIGNTVRSADQRDVQLGINKEALANNKKYVGASSEYYMARAAEIRAGKKGGVTPGEASRMAKDMAKEWAENQMEDISPEQQFEQYKNFYDMLTGFHQGKNDPEDGVVGPGGIEEGGGGFEDEDQVNEDEEAQAKQDAIQKQEVEQKKAKSKVDSVISELNEAAIDAMSPQERAADSRIPLTRVLNMGPKEQVKRLNADVQKFDGMARNFIARGIPPEQWPPELLAFIVALEENSNKQK